MKTAVSTGDEPYPPSEVWFVQMWREDDRVWVTWSPHHDQTNVMGRYEGCRLEYPDKMFRVVKETIRYTVEVPPTGAVPGAAEDGEAGE